MVPPANSYNSGPSAHPTIRTRRSSLIHKRNLLIAKMLAYVLEQALHTVRHVQRSYESLLVITKRHRDTSLVYVQAGKHVVVLWYKRFLSHGECLLEQCLWVSGIVAEHPRLEVDIYHTSLSMNG